MNRKSRTQVMHQIADYASRGDYKSIAALLRQYGINVNTSLPSIISALENCLNECVKLKRAEEFRRAKWKADPNAPYCLLLHGVVRHIQIVEFHTGVAWLIYEGNISHCKSVLAAKQKARKLYVTLPYISMELT